MTFNIITFGCKVNQCESENILENMVRNEFEFVSSFEVADIVIINSCTVTAESDRKMRQMIHKVKRKNPHAIIVLAGCMPQAEPELAKNLENVDIIVGNSNKALIVDIIKNHIANHKKVFDVLPIKNIAEFEKTEVNYNPNRSRAFLKIEDGCNRFCSYCIIPYARGKVRSKPLEDIKKDAYNLAENGYKEIVLVGINLSSYGMDLNCDLADAVKAVAECKKIKRVRLSSLEPDLMTDELIDKLSKVPKLCSQFHLALQSGSDKVLESMRRRYTQAEFISVTEKLRKVFPNVTFTTDIMVGFPGETQADFQDTLDLIKEVGFLKVHAFPYSIRPGTLAANMENQIDKSTKSLRVRKVIEISEKSAKLVFENFFGKTLEVLYETKDSKGYFEGYTSNYIPVKTKCDCDIRGKIINTKLIKAEDNFCIGELV